VHGQTSDIRDAAIDRLLRMDSRSYVGLLINWIGQPTRYEVDRPARGQPDALVQIEDSQVRIERHYRAVPLANDSGSQLALAQNTGGQAQAQPVQTRRVSRLLSNGHYGLFDEETRVITQPGSTSAASDKESAREAVDRRIAADLAEIDRANGQVEAVNSTVIHALYKLTGKMFGSDQAAWTRWWTSELGYSSTSSQWTSKPVVIEEVSAPYAPPPPPRVVVTQSRPVASLHNCFGAGTQVVTRSGPRVIEELRIGDQVLAQDAASGALDFEPIVAVLHNPPAAVLRVRLDNGEWVVATDIHRFWRVGQGWTMTRELKPGDRLRALGGTLQVAAVERELKQLVYNLEVAHKASFFVGRQGVLVHDATLVAPVDRPFDR
jgi:hypothetical protein